MNRRITAAIAALVVAVGGGAACSRVVQGVVAAAPAFLIGDREEAAIGLQAARQVVAETPIYQDATLATYVQGLGERVASRTGRTGVPWTFTVLRSSEADAFALPGGYIFITSGMIARMKDEAELAGVLAHEAGHVAGQHSLAMIRQAALAEGLEAAVLGESSAATQLVAGVVRTLVLRGYGRANELAADELGARYLLDMGLAPTAVGDILARLEAESGAPPAWAAPLATHPTLRERLTNLERVANSLGGGGGGTGGTARGGRGDAAAFARATASLR